MENKEKTTVEDVVYGLGIFIMIGIMVLGAVLFCMNDYKDNKINDTPNTSHTSKSPTSSTNTNRK